MDNMTNIISGHNRRVTNSDNETDGKTFNFRNKNNCPLKKNVWSIQLPIKLKLKPTITSISYLLKFISVLGRQNLSPGTTTIQFHLETRHTKMIPNFPSIFGV